MTDMLTWYRNLSQETKNFYNRIVLTDEEKEVAEFNFKIAKHFHEKGHLEKLENEQKTGKIKNL